MSKDVSDKQSQTVTNQALAERRGLEWRHFHTPFSFFSPLPRSIRRRHIPRHLQRILPHGLPQPGEAQAKERSLQTLLQVVRPAAGHWRATTYLKSEAVSTHVLSWPSVDASWKFEPLWEKKQQLHNCHFVFNPLFKWIDAALWRCSLIRTHCLGKLHYTVYYS